jgi:hypothetical protein
MRTIAVLLVVLVSTARGQGSAGSGSLEVLKRPDGTPYAGASVLVSRRALADSLQVTGANGRAFYADLKPGTAELYVRSVGAKPASFAIPIAQGINQVPVVLDPLGTTRLDRVLVLGGREILARHIDFETRRQLGQASAFITSAEIEKRNPRETWQVLTNIPAIRVSDRSGMVTATSPRTPIATMLRKETQCFIQVLVDGRPLRQTIKDPNNLEVSEVDLRDLPLPSEIHGIAVFGGPATIPPQYSGTGMGKWCGLIAVWTK